MISMKYHKKFANAIDRIDWFIRHLVNSSNLKAKTIDSINKELRILSEIKSKLEDIMFQEHNLKSNKYKKIYYGNYKKMDKKIKLEFRKK